jgi:hypothetical protein
MWKSKEMHKNLVGKPEIKNLLENQAVEGDNNTIKDKKS